MSRPRAAGSVWTLRAESPDRSGQDEEGFEAEQPGLNRRIFYEPPYSIWEPAVGFTVIVVGSLLYRWHWGQ